MSYKWVKRIARGMLPCFVFFVFSFSFAPKAHAAEANISTTYGLQALYTSDNNISNSTLIGTTPINGSSTTSEKFGNLVVYTDLYIWAGSGVQFSGPVKLYASYRMNSSNGSMMSGYLNPKDFTIGYTNSFGQTGTVASLDKIQAISTGSGIGGKTIAIEASWEGSEGLPISAPRVYRKNLKNGFKINANASCSITYTSLRFISSDYSAELEQLDKVADAILEQNDVLLAMKGDIVAILQDIYEMTGDMYQAQNLLNTYISQMFPLLQHIDQTTTDIYSLLSTQLRLLETAIENAADSVEAAIAAQTAAMIAYLDSVLNTGNEVPDDTYQQTQDAENILDQLDQLEKPNVDTIVPTIDDYSNGDVSGVLNAIWGSNLIMTMMTVSVSLAFGAYVLFGKRS